MAKEAAPEQAYSRHETERILSFGIRQLSPGLRAVVQLYYLDERSLTETAQVMGLSVEAVKSRVLRGRRHLRETRSSALCDRARDSDTRHSKPALKQVQPRSHPRRGWLKRSSTEAVMVTILLGAALTILVWLSLANPGGGNGSNHFR